ncbi:unnamed protein product [Nezara viridula]|uniref:Spaetzle domain-containing protein n=1 Tax=Nezara viridula TaxID=85310 RepID=A0A9P0HK45_NEZVI|nr:unnamed protein product [Nezara viridula]
MGLCEEVDKDPRERQTVMKKLLKTSAAQSPKCLGMRIDERLKLKKRIQRMSDKFCIAINNSPVVSEISQQSNMDEITGTYQPQAKAQPNFDMATILAALTLLKDEFRSGFLEQRKEIENFNNTFDKYININDAGVKNESKMELRHQAVHINETNNKQDIKSEDVTNIQSSSIQDGEPLGSNNDESTMEIKDGEDPTNVQSIENFVVDNNENLDGSHANEEIKETTDDEKDCGTTVICEESMAETVNDSEPSGAEKENIDEEKEILIENELMKEDESRSDKINPDLPVIEETDVSEDKKEETVTDITTNDRPSKPKDKVVDIRFYELSCREGVEGKPCRFMDRKLHNQSRCVQKYSYTYAIVKEPLAEEMKPHHRLNHFTSFSAKGTNWMLDYIRVRSGCSCEVTPRAKKKRNLKSKRVKKGRESEED